MKAAVVSLIKTGHSWWPTGLLSLISYIHAKSEHEVELIDEDSHDPAERLRRGGHYDFIGISAMSFKYEEATRLATKLRVSHPSSKIIIGGVHISSLPQSMRPCFDLAILGEAEEKFLDLLNGNYDGSKFYPRLSLKDYPPLNHDLINPAYFKRKFLSVFNEFGVAGTLLSSRGCPYRCPFCSTTRFWAGPTVKMFPLDWVLNEVKEQAARGVTHLYVCDDLFTVNKTRLRDLARMLKVEGLGHLKLIAATRASLIDDETCELLVNLNVKIVNFGFESGNARVLSWLKSGTTTVADNENAVRLCHKHGLLVTGSLIFTPEATLRENLDTVQFAYKAFLLGADSLWHFPLTPYPGTPVWAKAEADGLVSAQMNFDELDMNPGNKNYRNIHWLLRFLMLVVRILLRSRRMFRQRRAFFKSITSNNGS